MLKTTTVLSYYSSFELPIQKKLGEIHGIIKEVLPNAEEIISYKMPAFKQKKVLVYYAVYKNHIGFYPTSQPIEHFKDRLTEYKWSKGAIQFPLDKPLPKKLIQEIALYRLKQVEQKFNP
jgi:uncharacterized protein YdhG (YjbR/CyaY superfamily)